MEEYRRAAEKGFGADGKEPLPFFVLMSRGRDFETQAYIPKACAQEAAFG